MNTQIEKQEKELAQQVESKLAELRAMPVEQVVTAEVSNLFSLIEIMGKLNQRAEGGWIQEGQMVRIEQANRVLVRKRTADGWEDVAQCCTEAPTWSDEKGWND